MNRKLKFSTRLNDWAQQWYGYTFNAKEAKKYTEMDELRAIIKELRRQKL